MRWWNTLLQSPTRRRREQERRRRQALAKAKTALRREWRGIRKRQAKTDALRHEAVRYEREGKGHLARQKVRRYVQMDKEILARTLALDNMEYVLDQAQAKDNYDDFARSMQVVANIEELAQQIVDPDAVRERLADLAQRNQDLIEPWTESLGVAGVNVRASSPLNTEEAEAYEQVVADAASAIEAKGPESAGSVFCKMDTELERKMQAALGQG